MSEDWDDYKVNIMSAALLCSNAQINPPMAICWKADLSVISREDCIKYMQNPQRLHAMPPSRDGVKI